MLIWPVERHPTDGLNYYCHYNWQREGRCSSTYPPHSQGWATSESTSTPPWCIMHGKQKKLERPESRNLHNHLAKRRVGGLASTPKFSFHQPLEDKTVNHGHCSILAGGNCLILCEILNVFFSISLSSPSLCLCGATCHWVGRSVMLHEWSSLEVL